MGFMHFVGWLFRLKFKGGGFLELAGCKVGRGVKY